MAAPDSPAFLIVLVPPPLSGDYIDAAAALVTASGGTLLAAANADETECLESGTPPAGVLVARFASVDEIHDFWSGDEHSVLATRLVGDEQTLALAVTGLPFVGLPDMPDVPTVASVKAPKDRGPRHYMVIQGTGSDQERMDRYRDIILPMIAEQGAYYTLFELAGNIDFLHGSSPYPIIAMSRWPDYEAGHAFWDSDRYQNVAIPTRTGAGEFHVHYFPGIAG